MKIFEEWLNERFVPFSSLLTKEDGQKYIKELKKVFKEIFGYSFFIFLNNIEDL